MAARAIVWSRRATQQLRAASDALAGQAPFMAAPFLDRVLQMVEELSRYPDLGQKIPEYDQEGFCQRVFLEFDSRRHKKWTQRRMGTSPARRETWIAL